MTDHYQILGVPTNATAEQIKSAYREYAKHYHPDKHSNNEFFKRRFQDVQSAYEILSDATRRAAFDRQQHNGSSTSGTSGKAAYDAIISGLRADVGNLTESVVRKDKEIDLKQLEIQNTNREVSRLTGHVKSLESELRQKPTPSTVSTKRPPFLSDVFKLSLCANVALIVGTYFALRSGNGSALTTATAKTDIASDKPKINMTKVYDKVRALDEKKRYAQIYAMADSLLHSGQDLDTLRIAIYDGTRLLERADLLSVRGYGKTHLDNDTGAVHDFTLAILSREKMSAHPFVLRYDVKNKLGDSKGAKMDIDEAISIEPKYTDARTQRGDFLFAKNNFAGALLDYRVVEKYDPNDAGNMNSIANCLYNMNQHDSACAMWRKAGNFGSKDAFDNIKKFCN